MGRYVACTPLPDRELGRFLQVLLFKIQGDANGNFVPFASGGGMFHNLFTLAMMCALHISFKGKYLEFCKVL